MEMGLVRAIFWSPKEVGSTGKGWGVGLKTRA
jgi:hypothetical protein